MDLSLTDLTRLAFSAECRDLSDLARSQVPTTSDGYMRAGELLAEALRLRASADQAVGLAVAYERARGTSWEEIGTQLDASRQAAHERYATAVDEVHEGILYPWREGDGVMPGWWACPDGLEQPERTAAGLDEWVRRHREATDPDRGGSAVTGGLGGRKDDRAVLDAICRTIDVADRLMSRRLPRGVSERSAHRMLLESKVLAYDTIAERDTGARARDARRISGEAFEGLIEWHRTDVRERVGHVAYDDNQAFITLDGRPVRLLTRDDDGVDEDTRGWFLWSVGDQSSTQPVPSPQLPAALVAAAIAAAGGDGAEFIADVDAPLTTATAVARDTVCESVATDAAKGIAPFGPGGMAGPASS